jgi:hypothetical protein
MEKELYKNKYLKYKRKYLDLKYMFGGNTDTDTVTYTQYFKDLIDLYNPNSKVKISQDQAIGIKNKFKEKMKESGQIIRTINYNKGTYELSDKKNIELIENGVSIIFKQDSNIKMNLPNNTISAEFENFDKPIGKYKKENDYEDYTTYLYNQFDNKHKLTNLAFYKNFNQPLGADIKTYLPPTLTELRLLCNTFNQPLGFNNTSYLPSTLTSLIISNENFSQPLGSGNTIYLPSSLVTIYINYNYNNIKNNLQFLKSRTFLNNETVNIKKLYLSNRITDSQFNEIKSEIISEFNKLFPGEEFDKKFIIIRQIQNVNCND